MPRPNETTHHQILALGSDPKLRRRFMVLNEPLQGNIRLRIGDTLHFTSRVVYTSNSFVCVEASIERTSRDRTTKALSNSCFFTFVNVDSELAHQPVPPIYPATYAEDARYLAARRGFQALAEHHKII